MPPPLLAFGAHPDDIEFGCGGVIALETARGRAVHFVVCSRGESASNGTPDQREREARSGAETLGATVEFIDLGGDAHIEVTTAHTLALAKIIRLFRPAIVLAPSVVENQHPDHARLGRMVRDAARLARYGGVDELRPQPPHAIDSLYFYAVSPDAEPRDISPILVDISDARIVAAWTTAMHLHGTQAKTRDYVELQLARARVHGARCGVSHATPLFPNDPPLIDSLAALRRSARQF